MDNNGKGDDDHGGNATKWKTLQSSTSLQQHALNEGERITSARLKHTAFRAYSGSIDVSWTYFNGNLSIIERAVLHHKGDPSWESNGQRVHVTIFRDGNTSPSFQTRFELRPMPPSCSRWFIFAVLVMLGLVCLSFLGMLDHFIMDL